MNSEREVEELVAWCETVMADYHHAPRTPRTTAMMATEIRRIAVAALELGLDDVGAKVVRPVSKGMVARFGPETGARVFADFLKTFAAGVSQAKANGAGDRPRLHVAG